MTSHVGRPRTVYLLVAVVALWSLVNLGAVCLGAEPWDPAPFFGLQAVLSVYGAAVSTSVLTTQLRDQAHSKHRAYLDLQINLTAEQKAAKIIALLEELRRDIPGVVARVDPEADAMERAVDGVAAMSALQESLVSKPV